MSAVEGQAHHAYGKCACCCKVGDGHFFGGLMLVRFTKSKLGVLVKLATLFGSL